ncbi:MAG: sodium:alanine symporter family protein [Bacillota bacterium]|nr:sodium:alanine symporter family protein [Bacillota bacterium]
MAGFIESVETVNSAINNVAWGIPMLTLLIGAGLWLTIGSGGVQFAHFGHAMKHTLGRIFKRQHTDDKGATTPFQALSIAMSATVGTGNIAGVSGAILLGGPGAVFWMWISALVGMATKYSEIVLAIKFRERNANGEWAGGPMYYIKNGLGKHWKWLGAIFCAFGAFAAFGIGNISQTNTMASSVVGLFKHFSYNPDGLPVGTINLVFGLIVAAFVGLVLLGGLKRIGAVTSKLVPFMSIFYIIGALVIIIANIGSIGQVLGDIFTGAFGGFKPVTGGVTGFLIAETVKFGFKRGCFSNEAGLGSAPIAHATADTDGPVQQGLYGIFEVFVDTIIICTLTALAVLMSGVIIPYGDNSIAGALTTDAFASVFGGGFANVFLTVAIICFATSTILGWALYGSRCCEFLFGGKSVKPYQVLFVLVVVAGSVMDLSLAWDISDTLNALMGIPNLIGLLFLSPVVIKLTREYFKALPKG